MQSFVKQLPPLLELLADPTTPYTAKELWCRVVSPEWEECVPILKSALRMGDGSVKRLVMDVLCTHAGQMGTTATEPFHELIADLLFEPDRIVRNAASYACRDLGIRSPRAIEGLRQIIRQDDTELVRQALITLLELDDLLVIEFSLLLRESAGGTKPQQNG